MRREDHEEFVDEVAQAVIDRIEERQRVAGLVDLVAARVFEMQKQQRELEEEQEKENDNAER